MNVAVMGCVVNGPGESRHADIGISLPGTGEVPSAPVFVDGERTVTLKGEHIAQEFQAIVEQYVERRYGQVLQITITGAASPAGKAEFYDAVVSKGSRPDRHERCSTGYQRPVGSFGSHRARLAVGLRLSQYAYAGA